MLSIFIQIVYQYRVNVTETMFIVAEVPVLTMIYCQQDACFLCGFWKVSDVIGLIFTFNNSKTQPQFILLYIRWIDVIHRDLSAGVHCTLVETSNPNFVDINLFFCKCVGKLFC